jgi:hypothetical protein
MVLDYLKYGKHAATTRSQLPIGKRILKLGKDGESVTSISLVRNFTVNQLGFLR